MNVRSSPNAQIPPIKGASKTTRVGAITETIVTMNHITRYEIQLE